MSLIKQLKDAESQIAALQGQVGESHEQLETQTKTHAEQVAKYIADAEASEKQIAELKASDEAKAKDLDAKAKAVTALEAERAQVAEHVAKLEKALADPSFAAAAAQGDKPVAGGGEAGEGEPQSLLAQLDAIKDPQERNAFYNKNKAAIKAEHAKSVA